jgi:hypothetical protein
MFDRVKQASLLYQNASCKEKDIALAFVPKLVGLLMTL